MDDFQESFDEFRNDLMLTAEASGELQAHAFFELYSRAALDSGDIIADIEYCPVRTGTKRFQIDGYSFEPEQGELILTICDFNEGTEIKSLNATDIESLFGKIQRFYQKALQPEFINALEETSATFEVGYLIYSHMTQIKRVRAIVFSNSRISIRKDLVTMKDVNGIRFTFSVLDFQRYVDIQKSRSGTDSIEIDFEELSGAALPCLPAHAGSDEYASYLVVLPGSLLANIYGKYTARLLEQNVRTFLQARTKVNKGIIRTIKEEPDKFFAYNNGLTATASSIELIENGNFTGIKSLKDFQIVNGGQTTASILYAKDKEKAELKDVFVQMKLSVVKPDLIEKIVPKISEYANTQNKVTAADFLSSDAYHLELEKLSRRISAPPKEGSFISTKWFYERARGQYKDQQAYISKSERNKFQASNPRDQMLVKTDLAKYEMTFECVPHDVCLGAQKCFMKFSEIITKKWKTNPSGFNEGYFKDAMSRALIFRAVDKMIGNSEWYKNDRGLKAQTVTYVIAAAVYKLKQEKVSLDYRKIWNQQSPPESLMQVFEEIAPSMRDTIEKEAINANAKDVKEFCKRQACWARVQNSIEINIKDRLADCLVDLNDVSERKKDDKKIKKIDNGIEAEIMVMKIPREKWNYILEQSKKNNIITPKEAGIIEFARQGRRLSEKQCLVLVDFLFRAEEDGISINE